MANKCEAEDELTEPRLGDRKPEEELGRIGGSGLEGLVDGVVGVAELLVDEFAADLMVIGQGSDRLAGQGLESHLLPCRRGQQPCVGSKDRCGGL